MKKNIPIINIFVCLVFLSCIHLVAEPGNIFFDSPVADDIWVGNHKIKLKIEGDGSDSITGVEVYLDGKLLKEFREPPYSFHYDFGTIPKNHILTAIARQNKDVKLRTEIHSYHFDDFRNVEVMQVVVPVAVLDSKGRYVQDLERDNFELFVDDMVQKINYFDVKGSTHFNLILLIDISTSMKDKIGRVKEAGKLFLENLMLKKDKAMIVFFNHEVFEDSELTNNINELYNSISVAFPFGATALYDAIAYCTKLVKALNGRNIIILFSDGEDNSSAIDPYTLMKMVEKSNTVIYSIGQQMNEYTQYKEILKRISTSSGGIPFFINEISELEKIYNTIRKDIRAQYILQFSPKKLKKRNRFRKITVKIKNSKKYTIRTLKGYYY